MFRFRRLQRGDLIDALCAEAREALIGGVIVPTLWEGRCGTCELGDGMRIPSEGAVAWVFPAGPMPDWRGRITSIVYQVVQ